MRHQPRFLVLIGNFQNEQPSVLPTSMMIHHLTDLFDSNDQKLKEALFACKRVALNGPIYA